MLLVSQKPGIPSKLFSTNVNISGYSFFSTKSKSQNGGVGLYARMGLGPVPRPDLNASSDHYETVWVECENTKGKNILICCAYCHPRYDPEIHAGPSK